MASNLISVLPGELSVRSLDTHFWRDGELVLAQGGIPIYEYRFIPNASPLLRDGGLSELIYCGQIEGLAGMLGRNWKSHLGYFNVPVPPITPGNMFISTPMSNEELSAALRNAAHEFVCFAGKPTDDPPTALDGILSGINGLCKTEEQLGEAPTELACESARNILSEAAQINQIRLDATSIEASEGDLLIHWDGRAKSAVLICSRDGGPSSIYTETLNGTMATGSRLHANATAQFLSETLAWVSSPL